MLATSCYRSQYNFTFIFVHPTVQKVHVRGGDLQTTFDDLHDSNKLTVGRQNLLLFAFFSWLTRLIFFTVTH